MLASPIEALDQEVFEAYLGGLLQESLRIDLAQSIAAEPIPPSPVDPLSKPFEALRCQVGQQQVLLPLMHLEAVTFFPDKLWQAESKATTDLGILSYNSQSIRVLDFSKFINPKAAIAKRSNVDYRYVLLFPSYRMGFACEHSLGIETLRPQGIHWKKTEGKMAWYIGILQTDLVPIVKLDYLAALISQKSC